MSARVHCEGPDCSVSVSQMDHELSISNMSGDIVVGWLLVTGVRHDVTHDFHNITCLSRWALDQRTAQEENR